MNGYNKTDQSILAYYCDHCGSKAQIFWYQHDTTKGFYACPKCDVPTVRTNPKFVRNPDYLKVAMNQSQFHEDHLPQPNPYLERLYPVEATAKKIAYKDFEVVTAPGTVFTVRDGKVYAGQKPRFLMTVWQFGLYRHTYCLLGPLNATAKSMDINRVIAQPKSIYP